MTEAQHITILLHKISALEEENKNLCDRININRRELVSMGRQIEASRKQLEELQNAYHVVNDAITKEIERIKHDWKVSTDVKYISEISLINRIQSALVDYWKEVE